MSRRSATCSLCSDAEVLDRLLGVWAATRSGLVLGQVATADTGGEIAAVRDLLDVLGSGG